MKTAAASRGIAVTPPRVAIPVNINDLKYFRVLPPTCENTRVAREGPSLQLTR